MVSMLPAARMVNGGGAKGKCLAVLTSKRGTVADEAELNLTEGACVVWLLLRTS